ncbi:MAG: hypothetical protein CMB80_19760 [Flammeovirgaceae bacterium]|nr:hypothetical protein [Flammeovirgaceae bacterium]MBE61557.1 hypothetical protein [Flammeovirgaceae bacterium]MBR10370.1 hypothetical protein [Rickettsiales bacterium]|tara:strand:- start:3496 stop:3867 length:372 start_codon:yes stop_codon:yes gene_type:complete
MAKKIVINLTYSDNALWWSADDKTNWAKVGPKSPVTNVTPDTDIDWIGDDTLDEVNVLPSNDIVIDAPTGSKKDKKAKVKSNCKKGDKCKYDIEVVVAATKEKFTLDPDLNVCDPMKETCPPT